MQSRQPKFSRMSALRPPLFPVSLGSWQPPEPGVTWAGRGSRNQNIVSLCEMVTADLQESLAQQVCAKRLGKCGSDFLHRRYEAAYAFLRTDRFAEHHHVH